MITIRYFARLREDLGTDKESLTLPANVTTVAAVRDWLSNRGSPWREALTAPAVLIAVNHEAANPATTVTDGDEIAFFPPVTGGFANSYRWTEPTPAGILCGLRNSKCARSSAG